MTTDAIRGGKQVEPAEYRVFTREFDATVHASDLDTAGLEGSLEAMLAAYGNFLDDRIKELPDLEAPASRQPVRFLVDMSGSMRGKRIEAVAACLRQQGDRLSADGVPFEILGYTTSEWKGGQSRAAWIAAGRPPYPGRLNDRLHICFKGMQDGWEECRPLLGHLIKKGFLKENLDGEALQWAMARAEEDPEASALVIITDGVPYCAATLAVNSAGILKDHLEAAIADLDERGAAYQRVCFPEKDLRELPGKDVMVSLFPDHPRGILDDPLLPAVQAALCEAIANAQLELDAKLEAVEACVP